MTKTGWRYESARHSLARRGIESGRKKKFKSNPKSLTYKQIKKIASNPYSDYDKDGVPNYKDCQPLNPDEHINIKEIKEKLKIKYNQLAVFFHKHTPYHKEDEPPEEYKKRLNKHLGLNEKISEKIYPKQKEGEPNINYMKRVRNSIIIIMAGAASGALIASAVGIGGFGGMQLARVMIAAQAEPVIAGGLRGIPSQEALATVTKVALTHAGLLRVLGAVAGADIAGLIAVGTVKGISLKKDIKTTAKVVKEDIKDILFSKRNDKK